MSVSSRPLRDAPVATERIEEERALHRVTDELFASLERKADSYRLPADVLQTRPWAFRRSIPRLFPLQGRRVLDIGCGLGYFATFFAQQGAQSWGADVTLDQLRFADRFAELNGLSARWCGADALRLPFRDHCFDVVFGSSILHHLPLVPALEEALRLLKTGGRLLFVEPLGDNPLVNLFRRLHPERYSAFECPLRRGDLRRLARRRWPRGWRFRFQSFHLTTITRALVAFFLGKAPAARMDRWTERLGRFDDELFRRFPGLTRFAQYVALWFE